MDQTLAALYGTNQPDETEDTEKLAAAALAEGLSEEEALDVDNLTDDDFEELAQSVLNGEGEEKVAEETEETETEEVDAELQEKVAEADHLGRVMAHAFVQESREIEKAAMQKKADLGDEIPGKAAKKERISRANESTSGGKGAVTTRKFKVKSRLRLQAEGAAKKLKGKAQAGYAAAKKGAISAGKHVAKHKGKYGLGAAGVGAAGAGLAAWRAKHASALDTLAAQRAEEMLAEAGVSEPQNETSPYDALAAKVEERALEMLQEQGYEVEAVEEQE